MKFVIDRLFPVAERRAVQHSTWMGLMVGIQMLGSVVGMVFSARILGLEGFGVLAIFVSVTALAGGLLYMPGEETITTYVTRSLAQGRREEAGATLRFSLGAALATALASYVIVATMTISAGDFLGVKQEHVTAMLVYATVLIFGAGQNEWLAVLRLADRIPLGIAAITASTMAQVATLAVAWWHGGDILMVSLAYAIGAGIYGVGLFIGAVIASHQAGLPLSLHPFSFKVSREIVSFQMAAFTKSSFRAINMCLDVVLMAHLTNASQLGLYRAARLIVDCVLRPFFPISLGVQIEYSRHWYASDGVAFRRIARKFTVYSLVLAALGYSLLALFPQPLIRFVLGPDFSEVVVPLLIMIPGAFVFAASMALHVVPAATGRGWPATIAGLVALVLQIAAIFLLTPKHGATGAAWAYTGYLSVFVAVILPFAIVICRKISSNKEST